MEALTAAGLMRPSGLAEVQRAKDDGRWAAAYGGTDQAVPDDLAAALAAEPRAAAMFEILTSQNRSAVVYPVNEAKRLDTRARRIAQYASMLARGETIYPQKRSLERGR